MSPRRSRLWLLVVAALTFVAIVAVSWALERAALSPAARLALAAVPVALWGTAIGLLVVTMGALDELERRVQLEALAIAFPAAMLLGMAVEYAQKAGYARGVEVGEVWPVMFLLYVPALLFARWRYR